MADSPNKKPIPPEEWIPETPHDAAVFMFPADARRQFYARLGVPVPPGQKQSAEARRESTDEES